MVIISLSDREVIDHLRGDALIEEVPGDTEQKKKLFSRKCSCLSPECYSLSHQAPLLREEGVSTFS